VITINISRVALTICEYDRATMKHIQIKEAKAEFSALVAAAERGEPTTITKHGKPAAVLVPVEDAMKLYPGEGESFVQHLLAFPGGIDFERDEAPVGDIDL
jgi:prevent-host-death family protein